jgi:WhiB family redox-sensing transcriptional regulator
MEEIAKRICSECPVREACLDYALRMREPEGIWGGLTADERRKLLRRSR